MHTAQLGIINLKRICEVGGFDLEGTNSIFPSSHDEELVKMVHLIGLFA